MPLDVAVRAALPVVGELVRVPAVVQTAVLRSRLVDAAPERLLIERGALEHRLSSIGLLRPADDAHIRAGLEVDRARVAVAVPATVVAHELTAAARRFAAGAIGIRRSTHRPAPHDRLTLIPW